MGAPSRGWRALAAFFGVALGGGLLFALVALVALQPRDGLAWVHVPDLGAALRVDAGLQTKPLKDTVVAAVLSDRALDGLTATDLSVAPALAAAPQQPTVAMSQPPAARPVTTPDPSQPAPVATPGPALAPTPAPAPAPAPRARPPSPATHLHPRTAVSISPSSSAPPPLSPPRVGTVLARTRGRHPLTIPTLKIRTQIILPFLLLMLMLGVIGTYLTTSLVATSLENRIKDQLVHSGDAALDAAVKLQRRHVAAIRLIANTEGIDQAVRPRDAAALRPVIRSPHLKHR